ncbi:MAG: twin-arginine translocase TatA/TatE family subunit [Calditrichota bacterium]
MNIGTSEILLILFVVLLLFGGKRLPELARSIGKGLSEFRRATQEIQREIKSPLAESDAASRPQPLQTAEKSTPAAPPVTSVPHASQPRTSETKPRSDS